jgi:hypothetical protein
VLLTVVHRYNAVMGKKLHFSIVDNFVCPTRGYFRCNNATSIDDCLPPVDICNGKVDCDDGSDEHNCGRLLCKGTFKPAHAVTSIKQSHALKGHLFLVLT